MLPTIRVDDEVYDALGRQAVPFVDKTPNDVLRRLLSLDDDGIEEPNAGLTASRQHGVFGARISPRTLRGRRPRVPDATPKEAYRIPILEVLVQQGGQADVRTVLQALEGRVQLTPADLASTSSGGTRWANRANWARMDMTIDGFISKESQRGVWEITDEGRKALSEGRVNI